MNNFFSTNNTIPTFFQFADLFGFVFCFFFNPLIFCTHTNEKIRFCIDAENVCGCNKKLNIRAPPTELTAVNRIRGKIENRFDRGSVVWRYYLVR